MTLTEFKELNKAHGGHFFDKDTMRFFNSRVAFWSKSGWFITSERDPSGTTGFTIRHGNLVNGHVITVGPFMQHKLLVEAKWKLKEILGS